ncbi:hypothetical protein CEXT_472361 [Caerostris extrusa]|uniref:Uncharacterized protein n=1 Tax=Caerostris extrusa TaxID=172846 RepID=A0AAV4V8R1_CAEEX|nr:hypothetical protein CEXT_472361 [Caerostris extrusa]
MEYYGWMSALSSLTDGHTLWCCSSHSRSSRSASGGTPRPASASERATEASQPTPWLVPARPDPPRYHESRNHSQTPTHSDPEGVTCVRALLCHQCLRNLIL